MAWEAYWYSGDDPRMYFLCIFCHSKICIECQNTIYLFQSSGYFAASLFVFSAAAYFSCKTGATWPDQRDYHSFFEYSAGGISVCKICDSGTAYNSRFGICDYEKKVRSCHNHGPAGYDELREGHGQEGKGHGNGQFWRGYGQEGNNRGNGQWSEGHGQEGKNNGNGQQEHGEGSH
ncbi:hypothetical protein F9C07_2218343 [Aspergillus flavus]|uniref:Uncharacterized protein n=1 Tax=Aspergillus flavus (strain ATCC 200026 / FGSC A1120 / IAM 13836 / NRRL 3357 / JCM 12722 / SRRC 167) TaxID=332952 RepID=A0A7U2MNK7_ASPFN|nr:hypothetical protein F9C07_2218343 [Aspergillus flavus]